jgi:hypothetical protein
MNPAKERIEPIPDSMDEPELPENVYEHTMHSSQTCYAGGCENQHEAGSS